MRFAYAGDRDIGVWGLEFVLDQGARPLALLVPSQNRASHADRLASLCPFLAPDEVLTGTQFRSADGLALLRQLRLDYIICVHFPYIFTEETLKVPRIGVLNLHPAYLPYNRGWHTPTWAILDDSPIGGTLHFMDTGVDTGDIVHQKRLHISPGDTADSLYGRIRKLELQVLMEAWPRLVAGSYKRKRQSGTQGTFHSRQELFSREYQEIDLAASVNAGELVRRLRALSTNCVEEAAYYEVGGMRYHIQVSIHEREQPSQETGS